MDELPWAMLPNGVHEHRRVLECLEQVRLDGFSHDHRHRSGGLQVLSGHRLPVVGVANDDPSQAGAHVVQRCRQRQDGHYLGCSGDVETSLARHPVLLGPESDHDVAKRPIVDVEHSSPGDVVLVEPQLVAFLQMVVEHRRQHVVRRRHGVHIARQMEVERFHRDCLAVAATGCTALDAERRTHRGLTDGDRGALADVVHGLAKTDRRRGLAFAERRRSDCGDHHVLRLGTIGQLGDGVKLDLRDPLAVEQSWLNSHAFGDFGNWLKASRTRDLEVAGN